MKTVSDDLRRSLPHAVEVIGEGLTLGLRSSDGPLDPSQITPQEILDEAIRAVFRLIFSFYTQSRAMTGLDAACGLGLFDAKSHRILAEIEIPGGRIDLARREVQFDDGGRAELSEREIELVGYLASHGGRAVAREELLANVWRISPQGITTRTIDMHVARLREKLRDDPARPAVLLTVRGKGYMFAVESGR